MKKRIISLGLAMVMCLACIVSSFAAGSGNSETLYLDDGTVITITILPDGNVPISRIGNSFTSFATARENTLKYNCVPEDGNYCELNVTNSIQNDKDKNAGLNVALEFIGSNGSIAKLSQKTIYYGERLYLTISNNNGSGLNCTALATIQAVDADRVEYYYSVDQSWK